MKNLKTFVIMLVIALGAPLASRAQTDNDPVVDAGKIVDALTPKDIVLDSTGQPTRARRDPSISLQVQFTFGSAELLPNGKRQLDELAMALGNASLANVAFELAGHTDAVGDAESNLRLSLDRANAVQLYLTRVHGLPPQRLQTIGYGSTRLANPGNPTAAVNRRVEVRRLTDAGQDRQQIGSPALSQPLGGRLVPTPR